MYRQFTGSSRLQLIHKLATFKWILVNTLRGKNSIHAFGNNSAESEPIWMRSRTVWAKCEGLALAHFGRDPCSSDSFKGAVRLCCLWRKIRYGLFKSPAIFCGQRLRGCGRAAAMRTVVRCGSKTGDDAYADVTHCVIAAVSRSATRQPPPPPAAAAAAPVNDTSYEQPRWGRPSAAETRHLRSVRVNRSHLLTLLVTCKTAMRFSRRRDR